MAIDFLEQYLKTCCCFCTLPLTEDVIEYPYADTAKAHKNCLLDFLARLKTKNLAKAKYWTPEVQKLYDEVDPNFRCLEGN